MMPSAANLRDRIGSMTPEALERLIYVVGSARGGTSITKDVIGLHHGVVSFDGPTHFLNQPWRHRKRVEERLWRVIYWLPASVRRDVVRDSLDEKRRIAFIQYVNQALERKNFRELYQIYPMVRAIDPDEPRDPGSVVAWLDKGNDFWGVNLLAKYFSQARFVFVVRDPRGSVASLAKRLTDGRPDTDFRIGPRDVIVGAIYWCNLVQNQLRFARRYPERSVFFRYEDMISRPLEVVPRLYEWLGLPALSDVVLKEKLGAVTYGASLDSKERGFGLSTKPLERWRSALSDDAVEIISEICGETAGRLGFEMNPLQSPRSIFRIARHIPSPSARAIVAAKLLYLAARERRFGKSSSPFEPLRLLTGDA